MLCPGDMSPLYWSLYLRATPIQQPVYWVRRVSAATKSLVLHLFAIESCYLSVQYFAPQYLPKEELYTPPMNIKVHDNRSFGRKPVVGIHSMKSMKKFRCEPASADEPLELPIG